MSGDASCIKVVALFAILSIVTESLAKNVVPKVPVVIFVVAKSGISAASKVVAAVTIPWVETVTFVNSPADTPLSPIDKTPFPSTAKGADAVGTDIAPMALVVATGKSFATNAVVPVIKPKLL